MADKEDEGGHGTNPGTSTVILGTAAIAQEVEAASEKSDDDNAAPAVRCSACIVPGTCAPAAAQTADNNDTPASAGKRHGCVAPAGCAPAAAT
ncbi:hypothetical protein H1R20_g11583, partial [Candolleomyces eurysporus]